MKLEEYLSVAHIFRDRQTWCEYWLVSWRRLEKNLCTVSLFEAKDVRDLLWYEIRTRKRPHVIKRLVQRYYRLEQYTGMAQVILLAANIKRQPVTTLQIGNGTCVKESSSAT